MNWYKQGQLAPTKAAAQKLGVYLIEALKGPVNPSLIHGAFDSVITDDVMLSQVIQEATQYLYQHTMNNAPLNENQQSVINEVTSIVRNPIATFENTGAEQ